jgi:peroxiredoxin
MNRMTTAVVLLSVAIFCFQPVFAADVKPLPIGSPAPDFDLPGVDGQNHRLYDYDSARILIILFTCNHCPTAQAYEGRIKQIYSEYKDKGIALVAINPNNPDAIRLDELGYTDLSDSLDEMKIRAKDHHFEFPYLYDGQTQKVSRAYGVLATPHLFIFDAQRKLRYQGRIDDSDVKEVHHQDARNALDALLAGKPVPIETTRVFGCSTKWIDKNGTVRAAEQKWNAQPVTLSPIDAKGVRGLAKNDTKNLRVINVWATWCGPCVAEMPELIKLPQMYHARGFELIMISADEPGKRERAQAVLNENHVAAANYIFNSDDHDALADALDKQWPGPLPHTLVVAPGGKVIYRHTGTLDPLELKQAIVGYLGRTY